MKRLSRDGALALSGKKHEDSCTVDVDICDQLPDTTISNYNNNNNNNNLNYSQHRYQRQQSRDLLGQAERGKIGGGSHSSSECSSIVQLKRLLKATWVSLVREKRRNSGSKTGRLSVTHQDSLEDVPDINSNNQDCIVDVMQEPLFDTSDLKSIKSDFDLQSPTTSMIERNGCFIELALLYDAPMRKMTVHVLQCRCYQQREKRPIQLRIRKCDY
ncbi:hypothetical protein PVAND_000612 [Polypedilum vanderplanki]|uniref:Uncharacterized protein n=1 Tax=Polypedilum vanderplanki TaxID=319348 RepID=A0A9J6BKP9_POLVA|nr:hypothetical protein PVAND_000612 [Polypedilum vanderplanki]